jgi:hypothetical protein
MKIGITLEIMYSDLNPEMQKQILKFWNLKSPQDANLDIFPLFVLEESEENMKEE